MGRIFLFISLILSARAWAGEITLLNRGYDSLAAHIAAVQSAVFTIDILTYEIRPCDPGINTLLRAIAERADRGIHVRMIVDSLGLDPETQKLLATYFKAHKMELLYFNGQGPLIVKNNRNHAKLFVIDGRANWGVYFADGRNLTDSYFGFGNIGMNYVGRDLMVKDMRSAEQAFVAFEALRKPGLVHNGPVGHDAAELAGTCLTQDLSLVQRLLLQAARTYVATLPKYNCTDINYYLDRSRFIYATPGEVIPNDGFKLGKQIKFMKGSTMHAVSLHYKQSSAATLDFILGTKSLIAFENQYYLPTFELWNAIHSVAKRAKVVVITNLEPETGNAQANLLMKIRTDRRITYDHKNYGIQFLRLANNGALRKEGEQTKTDDRDWYIHSKTAVRDHQDVMVGSFNLDSRSYSINVEETTVINQCPDLAKAIESEYLQLTVRYYEDMRNCSNCAVQTDASLPQVILSILGTNFF